MFRYRFRIVVLSLGVLFGYASGYRHLVHGHSHGHGHGEHRWREGSHACWHWPGADQPDQPAQAPGAGTPKQVQ
jgi:hypothetical protein